MEVCPKNAPEQRSSTAGNNLLECAIGLSSLSVTQTTPCEANTHLLLHGRSAATALLCSICGICDADQHPLLKSWSLVELLDNVQLFGKVSQSLFSSNILLPQWRTTVQVVSVKRANVLSPCIRGDCEQPRPKIPGISTLTNVAPKDSLIVPEIHELGV